MNDLTIRSAKAQQNLLEWSRRVADCRSSGLAVTRWCSNHGIKPKTYYNWQKKVFAAMIEQQKQQMEPEPRFVEFPAPAVSNSLVASVRIGTASLDIYSGAKEVSIPQRIPYFELRKRAAHFFLFVKSFFRKTPPASSFPMQGEYP